MPLHTVEIATPGIANALLQGASSACLLQFSLKMIDLEDYEP